VNYQTCATVILGSLFLLLPLFASASSDTNLHLGSRGNLVILLQQFLISQGLLSSDNASGYFGKLTQNAVIAFQRRQGIVPASGFVGPLTRNRVNAVQGAAPNSTQSSRSTTGNTETQDVKNYYANFYGAQQQGVPNAGYGFTAPSCPSGPLFSVSPVSLDKVVTLTPLGAFSPPDHVFPPPHQYFYVMGPGSGANVNVPVYAPGNMTLTDIGLRHYNQLGKKSNYIDYTLVFAVCDNFKLYFHHVTTLNYKPIQDAAQKILQTCTFSKQMNEDFCSGSASIPVSAGEQIGTVGDIDAGVFGLDMGARDYRTKGKNFANPGRFCPAGQPNVYDRCYTVCAFDYFTADIRQKAVFSSPMSHETNLSCGSIYADVAGTSQGYWMKEGSNNKFGESDALFIGSTNLNPGMKIFSIGTAMSAVNPGTYNFNPAHAGLVNRDPSEVVADGQIYCYETTGGRSETDTSGAAFIVQLLDATHLSVEQAVSSCGSGPWHFSQPTTFVR